MSGRRTFPLVLSAPSGAGKTTIANRLRERRHDVAFSVSATTRSPRDGERDGVHYHFVSAEHRELFKADPIRYAPQFGDNCAMALALGELDEANPENWLISDGKLYIFGKSAPMGPALFQQDLAANVAKANQNRPLIQAH